MTTSTESQYRQPQSINTQVARNLAITTNTVPQMTGTTPRWLLHLLPWVQVPSGTYRVNRTKIRLKQSPKIQLDNVSGIPEILPEELRSIPMLSGLEYPEIELIASRFQSESFGRGEIIIKDTEKSQKLYILVHGKVEVFVKGEEGKNLRVAVLGTGDYFGDADLYDEISSQITVRALTPTRLISLSKFALEELGEQSQQLIQNIRQTLTEREKLKTLLNFYGEEKTAVAVDYEGEIDIPHTFVDYEAEPREYQLSIIQTEVRVHTRVTDVYNQPIDQLREQLRLTIENIKEQQEWEIINNPNFGLLHAAAPAMRIQPRYSVPTPDDLDSLLSLVWKQPAFFLANPRAIAAFERECTRRGVPPTTVDLFGSSFITWRGVPLIPCDKLEVRHRTDNPLGPGKTNILLMRVGEQAQGVVGLHQTGIPGEHLPSVSVKFMGINEQAIASYLLSLYYSCAVLTDDALAVLENVEVGYYHTVEETESIERAEHKFIVMSEQIDVWYYEI